MRRQPGYFSISLIRDSKFFERSQSVVYVYALKQRFEVHLQFIIIEDVDYPVFCQSFLSCRNIGLLTLILFICNEFNCTTDAAHPEQGVPLPPRPPKSCSVFHALNGKLADLCTHSPDLKQPLFH